VRKTKRTVEAAITPEDYAVLERLQALSKKHLSMAAIAGTLLGLAIPQGPKVFGDLFQRALDGKDEPTS
jgi:hypothetical protein